MIDRKGIFINKVDKTHNNKYNYSLVEYINNYTKIKIICPIHGSFLQTPKQHLRGHGCKKCSGKNVLNTSDFVFTATKIHNSFFDYSLVVYENSHIKVQIICPIHGIFNQNPNNHLNGQGCPYCNGGVSDTKETWAKKAREIHEDKYDYSEVNYINSTTKVKIKCKKCKLLFNQRAGSHINRKQGCPHCKKSNGEKEIKNYLIEKDILFVQEKRFKKCIYKKELPFDFFLPIQNILIEYDGKQHFEAIEFFGGESAFIKREIKDKIKTDFCDNENIDLLRISYKENIREKLDFLFNI